VATSYAGLPNKLVSAPGGVGCADREMGEGGVPLVLFQHHAEFAANVEAFLGDPR
jgi:hypothetical protein